MSINTSNTAPNPLIPLETLFEAAYALDGCSPDTPSPELAKLIDQVNAERNRAIDALNASNKAADNSSSIYSFMPLTREGESHYEADIGQVYQNAKNALGAFFKEQGKTWQEKIVHLEQKARAIHLLNIEHDRKASAIARYSAPVNQPKLYEALEKWYDTQLEEINTSNEQKENSDS